MQPEARLVKSIRSYLAAEGAWSAKIHGGDNPYQEVGLPDIIACYRGWFVGLEVKVPGGVPSPRQLLVLDRIRQAGGIAEVVESVSDVAQILKRLTPNISERDLAYIAGFFDGEGTIYAPTTGGKRYPKIAIYQKEREVLDWIRDTLDMGTVVTRNPREGRRTKIPHYYWRSTSLYEVQQFIEWIRPYSRLAHRHAQMNMAYPLTRSLSARRRAGTSRK